MARVVRPSTSISKIVVRKWPAKIICFVWLKSSAIGVAGSPPP
jgi:hypothetical protein